MYFGFAKQSFIYWTFSAAVLVAASCLTASGLSAQEYSPVVAPKFSADVLPLLRKNCIACHNIKQAEGGLNLESVAGILAGGDSGEMLSTAVPHDSLLLGRARGTVDSIMPPDDNSVGAKRLTEAELSVIEQWIAAGAKDDSEVMSITEVGKSQWQPLPENLRSVYALAASPIESVVAVGRGNTIAMVDTTTGSIIGQLFDEALEKDFGIQAAHLDFVNALAFSPDGSRVVSGGYRTLKVWRRKNSPVKLGELEPLVAALSKQRLEANPGTITEEQRLQLSGWLKASESLAGKSIDELELVRRRNELRRQTEHGEFLKGLVAPATERVTKEEEAKKKADEAHAKKTEEVNEKKSKLAEAIAKVEALKSADPPATDEQKMAADKEVEAAKTAVESGEKELAATAQAAASAQDVHQRAVDGLNELNGEVQANSAASEQLRASSEQLAANIDQKTILTASYHADGGRAAAALSDNTVVLFDTSNGQAVKRLAEVPANIQKLLLMGPWLMAVSKIENERESFSVWNLEGGWELERIVGSPDGSSPFADRVTALDFSRGGKWLVVGGGEPSRTGSVTVIDTTDFSIASTWDENHSDIVLSVRVSPDGKQLASAGADKQIRVVDFPSGTNVRSLEGHTHHVLGIAWQDHGRRLASVSADRTIKVWNVRAGEAERTINGGGKELSGIAFVGNTSQIAVSSGEGFVRIYNTDNGGQVRAFNQVRGFQQSVAADPLGKWIAAGSTEGGIRVWPTEAVEPRVVLD